MPPEIKAKTPLAAAIYARMKQRGFSVRQLAAATDVVYETMRGTVSGNKPPSRRRLREICHILDLDFETINEMLTTEQMKQKFGRVPVQYTGAVPELKPIEELWHLLLPDEKEHVTWLVSRYAERRANNRDIAPIQRIAPRPVRRP